MNIKIEISAPNKEYALASLENAIRDINRVKNLRQITHPLFTSRSYGSEGCSMYVEVTKNQNEI